MRLALKNFDIAGTALNAFNTVNTAFNQQRKLELDERNQDRLDRESAENSQIRQLTLSKMRKEAIDEEESAELLAAMHTGDYSKLRPELAVKINTQLDEQGITPEFLVKRTGAAKTLLPIISKLAEQSTQFQQQAQAGTAPGLQQQDMVSLSTDPNYEFVKPHLAPLLFGKDRFTEKDGSPKLHKYEVGGKTVFGMVDQSDPVADVLFQQSTGRIMVPLKIKAIQTDDKGNPIKDATGNLLFDDAVQIPHGIATTGRGNGSDDPISVMTLPELQKKTAELARMGETALHIRKRAAEAELIKRSPDIRKGVSSAIAGSIQNKKAWEDAEGDETMQRLYSDPVMGGALKNVATVTRAFGGSPKEALAKAQGVIEKAQNLAADKAEGQAFIATFGGIMEAAGKNPANPYGGIVEFFKSNPAMIGRKGATEAVKAAQTAIASDRKDKTDQRRDELGWARVEALASRSAASGEAKAISQEKRNATLRLREAQREHAAAVKSGDPDQIAGAVDLIEALNQDAQAVGVKPMPVPKRPMTGEQEAALKAQAIENLKARRGAMGRFFNTSPGAAAVKTEMERLRKAGSASTAATGQMIPSHGVVQQQAGPVPQMTGSRETPNMPGSAVQAAAARTPAPPPAAPAQQPGRAIFNNNTVNINGQSYPLDPDGNVTIDGRRYAVRKKGGTQ